LPRPLGGNESLPPAENTLSAFEWAVTNGCDGVEFDVRFTRDRRAVLCHDPEVGGREISTTDYTDLVRLGLNPACLGDVLESFADSAYLDIELKVGGNEELVIAALRAKPPSRGYVVSSFFPEILLHLNQIDSSVPLGFICERREYLGAWSKLPIMVLIPHYKLVSEKLIDAVHQHGVKLFGWTVNQRRDLLLLAKWGVDGLISDDPRPLSNTFLQRR